MSPTHCLVPAIHSTFYCTLMYVCTNIQAELVFLCSQDGGAATPMQRLCLLKVGRSGSLVSAVQQYVTASLGPQIAEPALVSLASLRADSHTTAPIIHILSPGLPLHMLAFNT